MNNSVAAQLETLAHSQYDEIMSALVSMLDGNSLTLDEAVAVDKQAKQMLSTRCKLIRTLRMHDSNRT